MKHHVVANTLWLNKIAKLMDGIILKRACSLLFNTILDEYLWLEVMNTTLLVKE